jgi:CBS domain containing-hemolysin-like protein
LTGWKLASILVLVGANAFFVAAEFGLVAVRRTRMEELAATGNRRGIATLKVLGQLNLMLSGCQLGITFASLGLGAVGEPVLGAIFESWFEHVPPPYDRVATHALATAIAFSIITFLHVALGELVPKTLALAKPEAVALWVSSPMRWFTFAFRPLIWLFNETANKLLKMAKIEAKSELSEIHTPDEIAIIIEESRRGGTIFGAQSRILARTLEFPDKRAVEAMVPRVACVALSSSADMSEMLESVEHTGYSRFPVWRERADEFVAVVHIKDMLREVKRNPDAQVRDAMRSALVVPESLPLETVLLQMRRLRNHMAIVIDEFGSTAGILTLEDIIEELLGEIRDESDLREWDIKEIPGGYRVPGRMRPDELREATSRLRTDEASEFSGLHLPDGDYETIAGFILEKLGRLAKRGDEITHEGWRVRVANVSRRRIMSVDIFPPGEDGEVAPPALESPPRDIS